jgi:hypothetical protein
MQERRTLKIALEDQSNLEAAIRFASEKNYKDRERLEAQQITPHHSSSRKKLV